LCTFNSREMTVGPKHYTVAAGGSRGVKATENKIHWNRWKMRTNEYSFRVFEPGQHVLRYKVKFSFKYQ
jgi:hypothetical protein